MSDLLRPEDASDRGAARHGTDEPPGLPAARGRRWRPDRVEPAARRPPRGRLGHARRRAQDGAQRGGAVLRSDRAWRQRLDLHDPADLRPAHAHQQRLDVRLARAGEELDDLRGPQDVHVPSSGCEILQRRARDSRRCHLLARPYIQPEALLLLVPLRGRQECHEGQQQDGQDRADHGQHAVAREPVGVRGRDRADRRS